MFPFSIYFSWLLQQMPLTLFLLFFSYYIYAVMHQNTKTNSPCVKIHLPTNNSIDSIVLLITIFASNDCENKTINVLSCVIDPFAPPWKPQTPSQPDCGTFSSAHRSRVSLSIVKNLVKPAAAWIYGTGAFSGQKGRELHFVNPFSHFIHQIKTTLRYTLYIK